MAKAPEKDADTRVLEEVPKSLYQVLTVDVIAHLLAFVTINGVYGEYFTEGTAPARETVEVSRLPKDVNVEISMIAVL